MASVSPKTVPDREKHLLDRVRPRRDGTIILAPDDGYEGAGDFLAEDLDRDGNPKNVRLGSPEEPDGVNHYVGPTADGATRQNASQLPLNRPSYAQTGPLVRGHAPQTKEFAAKLPRPEAPLLAKIKTNKVGYPASTAEKPHWVALSLGEQVAGGSIRHTMLSPHTPFQLAYGRSFGMPLFQQVPEGITHVGVWMAEPGTGSAFVPGKMWLQRNIDVRRFVPSSYPMEGPFRREREAPAKNETYLPQPPAPIRFPFGVYNLDLQPGTYSKIAVTWVNGRGESSLGFSAPPYVEAAAVPNNGLYVLRPQPPVGATGYYIYVLKDGTWYRPYLTLTGEGRDRPFPLQYTAVPLYGYTELENSPSPHVFGAQSPPNEDTTGIPDPDSAPEIPVASGSARPGPGRLYARVSHSFRGVETVPSEARFADLASDEVLHVIPRNPKNLIPNAEYSETGPDGLPLYHDFNLTGGRVRVEDKQLVVETLASTTGTTPTANAYPVPVDPSRSALLFGEIAFEAPPSGALSGVAQVLLQQIDDAGAISTRTLLELNALGSAEYSIAVAPSGAALNGASFNWNASAKTFRIVHRFFSATSGAKNGRIRVKKSGMKDHRHGARGLGVPTAISFPSSPALPPETQAITGLDRPVSSGLVRESMNFESGLGTWEQLRSPADATTILRADAAAAIVGTAGLLLKNTGTASPAHAFIRKTTTPTHDGGLATKNRPPALPGPGVVRLHGIRGANGEEIVRTEFGSDVQVEQLTIDKSPTQAGDVSATLDGVATTVATASVKEKATLALAAPTNGGTVTVTLDGVAKNVEAGGATEVWRVAVGAPASTGTFVIAADGNVFGVSVYAGESAATTANRIATRGYAGYTTALFNSFTVEFRATAPGPRTGISSNANGTGTPNTSTVIAEGAPESAADLATRIRNTSFPGWVTGSTINANEVVFEAAEGGPKGDLTYLPGATGATGTVTTNVQGSGDSPSTLAAKFRALTYAGWAVSGSGAVVTWTATSAGTRSAATYSAGTTGASGTMGTARRGSNADLTAYATDRLGVVRSRRILSAIPTSGRFDLDYVVSGAGTDKAIISVWGSQGGAARAQLARWEGVDLTGLRVARYEVGVTSESQAQANWEIHVDDVSVTDRGQSHQRDHNALGNVLGQAVGNYLPSQPVRQDIYIQDLYLAVFPGETISVGAYLRREDVQGTARPLNVVALHRDGTVTDLGCVTGGITGTGGWQPYERQYVVPKVGNTSPSGIVYTSDSYELLLASRDMGPGAFYTQELASSVGTFVKRTGLYQTSGGFTAILDTRTPKESPTVRFGRRRLALGANSRRPSGTSVSTLYGSGEAQSGPFSSPTSDPLAVPDLPVNRIEVLMSGDGLTTPEVEPQSPYVVYELVSGLKPINVLLNEDGSELPGTVYLEGVEETTQRKATDVRFLPDGRVRRRRISKNAVGYLPPMTAYAFRPEAVRYLEENWGSTILEANVRQRRLGLKLTAQPEFQKQGAESNGVNGRHGWYVAKIARTEVVSDTAMS